MDYVPRRNWDGRYYACWRYVPSLAPDIETGSVVSEYGSLGTHWVVLRDCDCEVDLLYYHYPRRSAWNMDFP
jgi:hypothetical protein